MKQVFAIISIVAFVLASCGGGGDQKNNDKLKAEIKTKKEELEKLRKEITELETELAKSDTTRASQGKAVRIQTVANTTFSHSIDVQGRIDAEESVSVGPQMPGLVKRVYVHAGDRVTAGQVLAEIDVDAMTQQLKALKTQRDLAKVVFERQKNLWDQQIGTEIQFLQAKSQYEAVESQIAAMQEQINTARVQAPIAGTVDQVNMKAGEMAAVGFSNISIVNTGRLRVKAEVAEGHISKVRTGNPVSIFLPDAKKTIDTKITYAGQMISALNRTFNVEVAINPNEPGVVPNMVAVLKINDYKNDSAIVVPQSAIQQSSDGKLFVYVAAKNKEGKLAAEKRVVTYERTYGGMAEITSGLTAGDQLIVEGYNEINPGDLISAK
jgi:membrane fusion protein, multidrug efflux system